MFESTSACSGAACVEYYQLLKEMETLDLLMVTSLLSWDVLVIKCC